MVSAGVGPPVGGANRSACRSSGWEALLDSEGQRLYDAANARFQFDALRREGPLPIDLAARLTELPPPPFGRLWNADRVRYRAVERQAITRLMGWFMSVVGADAHCVAQSWHHTGYRVRPAVAFVGCHRGCWGVGLAARAEDDDDLLITDEHLDNAVIATWHTDRVFVFGNQFRHLAVERPLYDPA